MKKIFVLLCILVSLFSLYSCDEIGPQIDMTEPIIDDGGLDTTNVFTDTTFIDTTYIAPQVQSKQQKNVLLEEFTGVKCTNCVAGHVEAHRLDSIHKEKLVVISIHHPTDPLAEPIDPNQDFRITESNTLKDIGKPIGMPSAMINRVKFSGKSQIAVFKNEWAADINSELTTTTPVNILLNKVYNETTRELDLLMTLQFTENVTAVNNYSICLIENNINGPQLSPSGKIDNYKHEAVLRDYITNVNGVQITDTKVQGRVIKKTFKVNIPAGWNADNIEAVAFVHEDATSYKILQATSIKIK